MTVRAVLEAVPLSAESEAWASTMVSSILLCCWKKYELGLRAAIYTGRMHDSSVTCVPH
jgi:hypothetical protein